MRTKADSEFVLHVLSVWCVVLQSCAVDLLATAASQAPAASTSLLLLLHTGCFSNSDCALHTQSTDNISGVQHQTLILRAT